MWLVFVFGARCCSYSGGGGFALVNLQVALVFGYGKGSCHLDFCRNVGLRDRQPVRGWASVPLWCILLLAGVVGFTRLCSENTVSGTLVPEAVFSEHCCEKLIIFGLFECGMHDKK